MVVLRSVLSAGAEPTVRMSVSRDPYGVQPPDRPPSPTPTDAFVTLQRDGQAPEQLHVRPQTCYGTVASVCNAGTGLTETTRQDPFECGPFVSPLPVESGATYTLRAERPGLPPAQATVTVPQRAELVVTEEPSADPASRTLRVRLVDVAGAGTRFALVVQREFDGFTTSICALGGPRDTTIALGTPGHYETRFGTTDPVLLAGAREPGDALQFVTFTDDSFEGGMHEFTLVVPTDDLSATVSPTGRLSVQLAVLSEVLYEAYQISYFSLGDYNPFAEPINLPSNVEGGLGRLGAAALSRVTVDSP